MALTLALGLNGIVTDVLKLAVGRPRPDFFWRCFPNGEMNNEMECTGDEDTIKNGRKSFPSGHSSCKTYISDQINVTKLRRKTIKFRHFFLSRNLVSFASMCILSLYLMGKLGVYNDRGRGQSWRLIVSITPLFLAMLVAVSRTCDYHHHWQDVTIGSLIGISIAYVCYRQYYPSIGSTVSHLSYADLRLHDLNEFANAVPSLPTEAKAFLDEEKDTKWI